MTCRLLQSRTCLGGNSILEKERFGGRAEVRRSSYEAGTQQFSVEDDFIEQGLKYEVYKQSWKR